MKTANLSLQILPVVAEDKIYEVVDQVIEMIAKTGLDYVVGAMGTTIEGDLDELLDIVKKANEVCVRAGVERVASVVKIDYKPKGVSIDEKAGKYNKK